MRYVPTRVSLLDDMLNTGYHRRKSFSAMRTNIIEKEGSYLFDIELPGFSKEELSVELKNGYLTINAEKNTNTEEKDTEENIIRQERISGRYSRSFYIGDDYNDDDITAKYENGELKVTLKAKTAEEKANKTTIAIA